MSEQPTKEKPLCPIIGTDNPEVVNWSLCEKEKCALWIHDMECCCHVLQANTLYHILEELRRMNK